MSSVLCSSVCEAGLDTGLVTALAHSHRRAGAGGGRGRGGESMTKVKISSYRQYFSGRTQISTKISGPYLHITRKRLFNTDCHYSLYLSCVRGRVGAGDRREKAPVQLFMAEQARPGRLRSKWNRCGRSRSHHHGGRKYFFNISVENK